MTSGQSLCCFVDAKNRQTATGAECPITNRLSSTPIGRSERSVPPGLPLRRGARVRAVPEEPNGRCTTVSMTQYLDAKPLRLCGEVAPTSLEIPYRPVVVTVLAHNLLDDLPIVRRAGVWHWHGASLPV